MENTTHPNNKGSAKIITDPEKLKKQIKFNESLENDLRALNI